MSKTIHSNNYLNKSQGVYSYEIIMWWLAVDEERLHNATFPQAATVATALTGFLFWH